METLPNELLNIIISELKYKDVISLSKVNRFFKYICDGNIVWKTIYDNDFSDIEIPRLYINLDYKKLYSKIMKSLYQIEVYLRKFDQVVTETNFYIRGSKYINSSKIIDTLLKLDCFDYSREVGYELPSEPHTLIESTKDITNKYSYLITFFYKDYLIGQYFKNEDSFLTLVNYIDTLLVDKIIINRCSEYWNYYGWTGCGYHECNLCGVWEDFLRDGFGYIHPKCLHRD